MRIINTILTLVSISALFTSCATIPGKTREAQVQTVDQLIERTLRDLYSQDPGTKDQIEKSVGYAILDNKITKIPVVGVGAGYGVAVHSKSGERTYLRMSRFDIGGGWGARRLRPVLIFQNEEKFRKFIRGEFKGTAGAEAAAKVGESGAAGGAGSGNLPGDKGYSLHVLTDAGVSATVTVGVVRVKPIKLKK